MSARQCQMKSGTLDSSCSIKYTNSCRCLSLRSLFHPFRATLPCRELLTTKWGSEDTGKYMRASELKHGRGAMLAVVGYACEKFGITFDKISPHEYLSVTQNIKFADLAAMSPIDAVKAVPVEGYAQVFAAIAAIEIFELTHKDGELKRWETIAPGLKSGGMNGEIGWNPLKFEMSEKLRLNEIS